MTLSIVAELSGNHRGSIQTALDLLYAAKEAGATAVKLQTMHPDRIAAAGIAIVGGPWHGRELRDLYRETMTPWDWHQRLFSEGEALCLDVFSSPFDPEAVAFLETLDCPRYKVASPEVTDWPLLDAIQRTRKPVLLSDGMASDADLRAALEVLGYFETTIMRCVSEYPAAPGSYCIEPPMGVHQWGVSDHSMSTTVAVVAVARGASVIEKHLCVRRADGGPDAGFSLEPEEFAHMVRMVREAEAIKAARGSHRSSHHWLRKSLWVVADVQAGDVVSTANVRALRPALGCDPFLWPTLAGQRFARSVAANTPMAEGMV